MISLWQAQVIAEERGKDLEREAKMYKLYQTAKPKKLGLSSMILTWIGGQLIATGEGLRAPSPNPTPTVVQEVNTPICCEGIYAQTY